MATSLEPNATIERGLTCTTFIFSLVGKFVFAGLMKHLPRLGDEMRLDKERYGIVREVVWCMDELSDGAQRVNLGLERTASPGTSPCR